MEHLCLDSLPVQEKERGKVGQKEKLISDVFLMKYLTVFVNFWNWNGLCWRKGTRSLCWSVYQSLDVEIPRKGRQRGKSHITFAHRGFLHFYWIYNYFIFLHAIINVIEFKVLSHCSMIIRNTYKYIHRILNT